MLKLVLKRVFVQLRVLRRRRGGGGEEEEEEVLWTSALGQVGMWALRARMEVRRSDTFQMVSPIIFPAE